MTLGAEVGQALMRALEGAREEARAGMACAGEELERAAQAVLSGARSGRVLRRADGGAYRASAPGEPPARRTGGYMDSWRAQPVAEERRGDALRWSCRLVTSRPETALRLERGDGGMAARPHMRRIAETAAEALALRLRGGG